ncbi:C2H2 finger domain protein, putative [Talaromyces stipitatus ATCC 10500]|uniref:C2H2 finger domain protein, putative n=1 Tax=Talaromyces stipitatus (strain ATCC 10500 / CBS 375.48 / QM 6759 / NRRL 1006) TaxID=441959 RepID=B8M6A1_TALSN|nr:C2H2 finger domain protein, putative [Talaromyces stipitatus ATCC 10500]EED19276.1 C2H2 finger domain protein, putative [Talaromyces stipitatus ATCC 10500]
MDAPFPHQHSARKLDGFENAGHLNEHWSSRVYPAINLLNPEVEVYNSPTGERICTRCCVSYCCRNLYLLHVELSLEHNLCVLCNYKTDFDRFEDLQEHTERDHFWCEICNWYAPSYEGLQQHFKHWHNMCEICKQTFNNQSELISHGNTHRPMCVPCIMCGEKFNLRSASFNHMESGKCPSGATKGDIRFVVRNFWDHLCMELGYWVPDTHLFHCQTCQRYYQRLSDLFQHRESKSCREGYCKVNSITERLMNYLQEQLPLVVEARKKQEESEKKRLEAVYSAPSTPSALAVASVPADLLAPPVLPAHPRILKLRGEPGKLHNELQLVCKGPREL